MAEIVGGGTPANDAERLVIAHLRDSGPSDWFVLHNVEVPSRGNAYEIDLIVVTTQAVCVVDVKGTAGRIDVAGNRWYPQGRSSFASPVRKLRGHARALKGLMEKGRPELSQVYVDSLVVLPAPDARLVDPSDRADADAVDVVDLAGLIPALSHPARVRSGMARNIAAHAPVILQALGVARRPTGPKRFGNWVVAERLGGDEEVTEYRARNASVGTSETVLLRVYRTDPFLAEADRGAQRVAIANAYEVLTKMPPSPFIVGRRDFFPTDDDSQLVLVLDDVRGQALAVHLTDPKQALGADGRLRVITDLLRGLAHAHAHGVLHRALSPSAVLVTEGSGRAVLTGFDYGRPEGPRDHSVIHRLADALDPAYVAPECQGRAQAMSRASDVYAAGVVAFQLLTGELPFLTSADQMSKGSVLPSDVISAAGISAELAELLRRMCALAPSARPTATDALRDLVRATRPSGNARIDSAPSDRPGGRLDYRNLPVGHQLTRKFTIRRKLGSGSFGTAYQAYDNLAAVDRVVKIVHRDRESVVERLKVEYQTLLRLAPHRSVVKVESADYLDGGEVPYLVFEFVDGQPVNELRDSRALGPADTVRLGVDVAEGLTFLHDNGIYHCDIKPGNLLRTDTGCKIFDFNVAVTDDSSMSRTGGTTRYAPADFAAAGPVTAQDLIDRDVYALGLTLYEVLTGTWPLPSGPIGQKPVDPRTHAGLADLSDELVDTLLKAIAPLRSQRFGSAQEFMAALRAIGDAVQRPAAPSIEPVAVSVAVSGTNPFVDYLQTLYSQSTRSNAGTRSGSDPGFGLYISTALDERLTPDVLKGRYRLVIITGNAGDGKTAYLERLLIDAARHGGRELTRRDNGADLRLPSGHWLRTNHDGSQDEADVENDAVLQQFFSPFVGPDASGTPEETRLIAINEGRLVDFLNVHAEDFPALANLVRAGLAGAPVDATIAIINLNRRSLLQARPDSVGPVFDRMVARMTDPALWQACNSCALVDRCYARHNAQTFAHGSLGPKITSRLRTLFQVSELRGTQHHTMRDTQSALAFMLTSGRDCAEIHDLYAGDHHDEVLDGFYFNSWRGRPGSADRLLALLAQVDVATVADPALDRRLDYVGPDAGRAVMTIDQRGDYDVQILSHMAAQLPRTASLDEPITGAHGRYLAATRRRFYFECVDDSRARRMLPYRSATEFIDLLTQPDRVPDRLSALISALNRGEGIGDSAHLSGALALQVRAVPGGSIRSYRLFPADHLALAAGGAPHSEYLDGGPQHLDLMYRGAAGHTVELRIYLDLFEHLARLRDGYLPGVAERQGLHLGLTIFKNELSAAPYQEILLTVTGEDLHRVRREADGRVRMEPVAASEGVADGPA